MNQLTSIVADPIEEFVTEAARRLAALDYDIGHVQFECVAWKTEKPYWRFRPSYLRRPNLSDITAPTRDECLALAKEWLKNLKSEEELIALALGTI